MNEKKVTINEMIARMVAEARRLGYSESSIWTNNYHQWVCLRHGLSAGNLVLLFCRVISRRYFLMGAGIQIRLRRSLSDGARLRLLLLCVIMDIGGGPAVHFPGVSLRSLAGIKFQRLSVLLAPRLGMAEDRSTAADRPHAVYFFFSHPGPPYRSCCFAGFCFLSGSAGFVSFIRCRTEGLRSGSSAEVILTYSPMMFSASW